MADKLPRLQVLGRCLLTLAMAAHAQAFAQTNPAECLGSAARYHHVNAQLLAAVLQVESRLNPQAVHRNTNGTLDIGIGQINSIHLAELRKYGVAPHHLLDACIGSYVSAWLLRRGLDRYGRSWFAVASYHSVTPQHNARYQKLVQTVLRKRGLDLQAVLDP